MSTSRRELLSAGSVGALALAATIGSIGHDFTYDDRSVIFDNDRVHAMWRIPQLFTETYWPPKYGGDGYRPIVTTLFTMQWSAAHGAPWLFHLVNILLAVATALAVFWCISAILPPLGAWVAAALFAVHPVHVEVTGNVVGQSELLVALFVTLAMGVFLRQRTRGGPDGRSTVTITALFALALFSKEHAIVLPALIVAAELVLPAHDDCRARARAVRPLLLALTAVALGYLLARGAVQSDLTGFIPFPIFRFLRMSATDRIGTMMNEMPRIAQLLVFPVKLSADYSPNDVIVARGFDVSQLPGIIITCGTVLLAVVLRKRAPVASFGLFWLIVSFAPVSNLIIPAGFVTAERTLFLPSVGVLIVVGVIAEYVRARAGATRRTLAGAALAALILAGLARSIDRMHVWKNNDAFFVALMRDAPNGYRAHFLFAKHVGLQSHLAQMEMEYRRAIRIFPYDAGMTLSIADSYTRAGLCAPAVALFEWTFSVEPEMGEGRYEYVYCLAKLGRWTDVRSQALAGLKYVPSRDLRLMRAAVWESARVLRAGGKYK